MCVNNKMIKKTISIMLCIMVAVSLLCIQPYFSENGTAKAAGNTTKYKIYVKKGPLNIRRSASSSSRKVGKIPKNKTVYASLKKKDSKGVYWYKAKYGKKTGYICSKYIKEKYIKVYYTSKSYKKAKVTAKALTVRSGASTKKAKRGTLKKNKTITVKGYYKTTSKNKWYKITYSGKTGYVYAKYTKLVSTTVSPSGNFEDYMTAQGFPSDYKPYLRKLHAAHPKWVFKAQKTGLEWSSMLSKERALGNNLVEPTSPSSWKSKRLGAYNILTGKYTVFDGRWNQASDKIMAYYLDPRNFLNDTGIYQFMSHYYNSASQNKSTILSITSMNSKCFMNNNEYATYIYNAGKSANVNPNVLTAMIIQEQGWYGGSGLISGKYKGYTGYYNFFNVGAYTTSTMNATQRGLWYAKSQGWNTKQKSITGGAKFYGSKYVTKNQYTYYTKKFNVMNGLSNVAGHEYMTNVEGAYSEGRLLKYAYRSNSDYSNIFYIPVYSDMPSKVCPKP